MADNKPTYNELKLELDEVLKQLQGENIGVEKATQYYERGMQLVSLMKDRLKTAELKITKLKQKFD